MSKDAVRDTKEEILQAALLLFAQKGPEGVSIREIAAQVGLRESSLYRHYPGKQALYQSVLTEMGRRCRVVAESLRLPQGDAAPAAELYRQQGFDFLRRSCRALFLFYRQDVCAAAYFRLLTGEQLRGGPAGQAYRETLLAEPLAYYRALFARLMVQGLFRGRDPGAMAMQFYSPVLLLLSRYVDRPDGELAALERHLDQFEAAYSLMPAGN